MDTISRRRFLSASMAGAAAAGYLSQGAMQLGADPLGMPIGCQTWPVRETIGKDLEGTLKQLTAAGFRTIELCSPPSYAKTGFGPLAELKASALRQRIHAAGMGCVSCHYGFTELKEHLAERMTFAKELGLTQMIISSFSLPDDAKMADWMRAADESNKLGEQTRKAGLQLGFHNHDGEFAKLGGELIYDKLLAQLDPKLVKMQFQVGVARIGYHAADYFEKYPGRFVSMHLQDWSKAEKKDAPVGQGIVDWKRLFTAAKAGGIKNYFVEMDLEQMRVSVPFLRKLS